MPSGFSTEHAPGVKLPEDMPVITEVYTRLRNHHTGKDKSVVGPIIVKGLASSGFQISEPKLRAIVNYLNSNGVEVIGLGKGYFFAETIQEIEQGIESCRNREAAIKRKREGLEIALKRKTGQAE